MIKVTPSLGAKGVFILKEPFYANPSVDYWVSAIRSFQDMQSNPGNFIEDIYIANGLTQENYEQDSLANANIITLMAVNQSPIYVPDTYILSIPSSDIIPYKYFVASVELGAMSASYDLSYILDALKNTTKEYIGVDAVVEAHVLPFDSIVSISQHESIETARKAAILINKTDKARLLEAENIIEKQKQKIEMLEELVLSYQQ